MKSKSFKFCFFQNILNTNLTQKSLDHEVLAQILRWNVMSTCGLLHPLQNYIHFANNSRSNDSQVVGKRTSTSTCELLNHERRLCEENASFRPFHATINSIQHFETVVQSRTASSDRPKRDESHQIRVNRKSEKSVIRNFVFKLF